MTTPFWKSLISHLGAVSASLNTPGHHLARPVTGKGNQPTTSQAHQAVANQLRSYLSHGQKEDFLSSVFRQDWVSTSTKRNTSNLSQLPKTVQTLLQEYPSIITLPIQWGAQDAFGHLNNVSYLRYAESGRMDYLARLGEYIPEKEFMEMFYARGVGVIAKSIDCKYKQVVEYPDTISVGTRVINLGQSRGVVDCVLVSHKTESVTALSQCQLVCYNYKKDQKCNISDYFRRAIDTLQATRWVLEDWFDRSSPRQR
ncbi:HotDog domain-containing protein [Dimargaris cristalligena]|uniref:HotDog domain-containing protein n=1 Tax=Dimargaris cristalligena TaxID=215637 RepID=A0A4P9ZP01_9FUNG|nr:HotDog domain-containing protein [Dimargaris cristalligena]|eukprot:RKP34070.1 HotDog domain-containing protein [Dimargaris cristalligena]